jgi:hypothetical protein
MRKGQTAKAQAILRKLNVEKMRREGTGRFNSELQSQIGKMNKGVTRRPYVRNHLIKAALANGTIWLFSSKEKNFTLVIESNSSKSLTELVQALAKLSDKPMQNAFEEKKSKSYLYIGVTKLLIGWRSEKTNSSNSNKCCYSVGPWKLQGIMLPNNNSQT